MVWNGDPTAEASVKPNVTVEEELVNSDPITSNPVVIGKNPLLSVSMKQVLILINTSTLIASLLNNLPLMGLLKMIKLSKWLLKNNSLDVL